MPDYNQGGFRQDDSGIYGDPTVQGSTADYDSWDWKQIMAAITGGSNLTPGAGGENRASGVAAPQTLMTAANDFQYVQQVLTMVAQSLDAQAKALAGGNGAPWQGAAADAFADTMATFSKQVASTAEALAGGTTGSSVAQNLVWSANALTVAQSNIHAIDTWYAGQAMKVGVKPMANGLIPVSQRPDIVEMMTNDMRAELKKLASNYAQVSQSLGQVQPKPVVSPVRDPGSANGNGGTGGGNGGTGGGSGGTGGPDLNTNTGTGGGGGTGGGITPPDVSTLDTGGGAGGTGGTASPFGGGTASPELGTVGGTGGGSGLNTPELSVPETGGGTASPYTGGVASPELGTGGGTGTGGVAAPYTGGVASPEPGTTGGGSGLNTPELSVPDTGGGTASPYTGGVASPELSTTGGTGTVPAYTGTLDPMLDDVLNPSAGTTGTPTPTALPVGALGSVPPTSGGGTGGAGTTGSGQGLSELPDTWTGGSSVPDLPGSTATGLPDTATTGLPDTSTGITPSALPASSLVSTPGVGEGTTGSGMPMMPMMPGAAGAGGAGAGVERPDAAGLLGGEGVVPWTGSDAASLDDAPVAGAASGGAGLTGAGPEVGAVPGSALSSAGMPMMPMAPGSGAAGAGG
ncbi:WXG100 family type VII secretion target, partial [Streptomyces griseoviridis]|uniref:WXG100 family type VII secretion target n=2 Tax=Streptomyces griseoviridis TaxID=45398 RepID=UPI0033DCBAF4